jgi:hypothetical protein
MLKTQIVDSFWRTDFQTLNLKSHPKTAYAALEALTFKIPSIIFLPAIFY